MDVITHTMIGVIGAAPFFEKSPLLGCCFIMGSLLPDLDSFLRCFGKRFYLKNHQVYTHSIPMLLLFCPLLWPILWVSDQWSGLFLYQHLFWAPVILMLGAILHCLLDYTNTFGIALFYPFSHKRYCTQWVFFIDFVVLFASIFTLAVMTYRQYYYGYIGWAPLYAYAGSMSLYWLLKWRLYSNCVKHTIKGTIALIPSAVIPWHYLGTAKKGEKIEIFTISAISGEIFQRKTPTIFDNGYKKQLQSLEEYELMCQLSSAYHAVEETSIPEGKIIKCRDLRTRNFNTTFGGLDVVLDTKDEVVKVTFHA